MSSPQAVAATRGPGFRPFLAASALALVSGSVLVAWCVFMRRFDLFETDNEAWRRGAQVDVALVALAVLANLAVAGAGLLSLARAGRAGRVIAIVRGIASAVATALCVVIFPVALVLLFMLGRGFFPKDPGDGFLAFIMVPGILSEILFMAAAVRALKKCPAPAA